MIRTMNRRNTCTLSSNASCYVDHERSIIKSHQNYYDDQEVYKDLLYYHVNSVKASLLTTSQMNFIIVKASCEWKGIDENFILHWQDKLRMIEAIVSDNDK